MGKHDKTPEGRADDYGPDDGLASTAGVEDHSDPWALAGDDADPPSDLGRTDAHPDKPRNHAAIAHLAHNDPGGG